MGYQKAAKEQAAREKTAREHLTARGMPINMVTPEDLFADLHKLQEGFDVLMLLDDEAQLEFLRQ